MFGQSGSGRCAAGKIFAITDLLSAPLLRCGNKILFVEPGAADLHPKSSSNT